MKPTGNPQLEDGHTRLANELLEAIIRYPFTGGELKVVLAIIRLTYGWQTRERPIKQYTLVQLTGLHPRYVHRVLIRLRQQGVLFRQRYSWPHHYALNKHYYGWRRAPQADPWVSGSDSGVRVASRNLAQESGQPGSGVNAAPGSWAGEEELKKEIKKEKKESGSDSSVQNLLHDLSESLHRPLTFHEHALMAQLHDLSPDHAQQLLAQVVAAPPVPAQQEGGGSDVHQAPDSHG